MTRLPIPGADNGSWGEILNDFLRVEHNDDGTLKTSYVDSSQKGQAGGVAELDGGGKVPSSQLPASALVGDATVSDKGIVQLAGDLGGTASAPTVPELADKVSKAGDTMSGALIITADGGRDTLALTSTGTDTGITLGGDSEIYRSGANIISTNSALSSSSYTVSYNASGNQVAMGRTAGGVPGAGITFGSAQDTNIYRSAADTLKTDDAFNVAGGNITFSNGTSNRIFYGNTGVAAPGNGSVGQKIQLYGAAGTVANTDYALGIEGSNFWLNSGGGYKFYYGSTLRMTLDSTGQLGIGVAPTASNGYLQLPAGTTLSTGGIAWGADTSLYRSAADTLRTDDRLVLRPTLSNGGIVAGLDVDNNPTAATQRTIGLISFATVGDSSLPSVYAAGMEGRVISNATGSNTVPTSYGLTFSVENRSSGIMTDARGINVAVSNYSTGTGTITNAYGVHVGVTQTGAGSGVITTGYGVYIRDITAGTAWGMYQVGATDFNYFGGYVGLGVNVTANIVSRLTLGAATNAAGGITWGTDTNLYRSAANTLKTDDNLIVAGAGSASGSVVTVDSTQSLSNKRLAPRVTTITSSATPTVNTDNCDAVTITALTTAITSMTSGLSGTPVNFQKLMIRIKDDGTARSITWGASFVSRGVTLPTSTVISKLLTVGLVYNSVTSTWDCVAVAQEA